jgi:predicted nucleic acid-binding protein
MVWFSCVAIAESVKKSYPLQKRPSERVGERFRPVDFSAASPDPADSKFLHCAMAARADFLVTGNRRDYPDTPYGHTRVVSAGELLDWITLEA